MGSIERPSFLSKDIEPTGFDDGKLRDGAFTKVANLENLPQEVKVKFRDGLVVKQYAFSGYDRDELNLREGQIDEHDESIFLSGIAPFVTKEKRFPSLAELKNAVLEKYPATEEAVIKNGYEKFSPLGIAKELRRRNSLVKEHFKKSLPDLVVPSQFIVSESAPALDQESQNSPYGNYRRIARPLFELQPRIMDKARIARSEEVRNLHLSIVKAKSTPDGIGGFRPGIQNRKEIEVLAAKVSKAFPAEKSKIKKELQAFIRMAKALPQKTNWLIRDLASLENLLITAEGLRLIDTNVGIPAEEKLWLNPGVIAQVEIRGAKEQVAAGLKILEALQKKL